MKTGLDRLFSEKLLNFKNKRVGILAHPASIDSSLKHILTLFLEHKVNVTHLFGPEHGIDGTAQDMDGVESAKDTQTGIPVTSLYGHTPKSLRPKPEDLKNIDILVCDLQDIGSRYYTFIYTMAFCMEECAKAGIKFIVLDRPNPINGVSTEGGLIEPGFESFVGAYSIPVRHGMTIGELALLFNSEFKMNCDLQVIKMKGWKRKYFFDETKLPWVLPSPNMPTLETAIVYPGMCLVEATNLSEGRGTTKPFEFVGAPFIDPHHLAFDLKKLGLKGIQFRPICFRPNFQKWSGQDCGGVQLHITDRKKFKPYLAGLSLIKTIYDLYPNDFKWREKPYEFVKDIPAIDLLTGSSSFRNHLNNHSNIKTLYLNGKKQIHIYSRIRAKYLIY